MTGGAGQIVKFWKGKSVRQYVGVTVIHIVHFPSASDRKSINATVGSRSMRKCWKQSLLQRLCPSMETERLSQGREQKEMSSFDGISPHCLWMMITLLSQIKRWWLNYIILTIHSYQSCPGPVLPAHIVLHTGGNLSFYCKDEKVANYLWAAGAEVRHHRSWFLLQPHHRSYLTKKQPLKNKVWKDLSDFSAKEKSANFHLYQILSGDGIYDMC